VLRNKLEPCYWRKVLVAHKCVCWENMPQDSVLGFEALEHFLRI
jgi:hypothetical protein